MGDIVCPHVVVEVHMNWNGHNWGRTASRDDHENEPCPRRTICGVDHHEDYHCNRDDRLDDRAVVQVDVQVVEDCTWPYDGFGGEASCTVMCNV